VVGAGRVELLAIRQSIKATVLQTADWNSPHLISI